jgi:hypothetical protein
VRGIPHLKHFADPQPVPRFSGGKMWFWQRNVATAGPNLAAYDRDGRLILERSILVPGASQTKIIDVAADSSGGTAIIGLALSAAGRYAGYLALLAPSGDEVRFIALARFSPESVTYASDGSIWIVGAESGSGGRLLAAPPHAVLRRYSRDGVAQGEFLQWPQFACGKHPILPHSPVLAAATGRVGVLFPTCNRVVELDLSGAVLWDSPVTPPDTKTRPVRLGYVSGQLALSYDRSLYLLDRTAAQWRAVDGAKLGAWNLVDLMGVDTDGTPVLWTFNGSAARFVWSPLQP